MKMKTEAIRKQKQTTIHKISGQNAKLTGGQNKMDSSVTATPICITDGRWH